MTLRQDDSTDCITNVLWLSPNAHVYFDNGSLSLVPDVPAGAYDPGVVSEVCFDSGGRVSALTPVQYTARVEFLHGEDSISVHREWAAPTKLSCTGRRDNAAHA